ncbi:MAG: alpha/beta hydrolase [Ornithinimicrobium sp.]|uniref:alpha/beta fold hydrolase n=1 Tax=Ornithinimicrobium sp. TaxID=1977084 RepID=UPI0026DEFFDF|nr:alpha/beta hydrolase [Ornithinimicrobium sp.]MDO5740170.1 alpha/beta hydrolase [Ornithinimicrobium sp.]
MGAGEPLHPGRLMVGSRTIAWSQYGDPDGVPAFYFHGVPGSRTEAALLGPAAHRAGVRIISLDRPGMGRSPHREERTVADWPQTVAECADQLGLGRFALLGWSGGGPYVVACLAAWPGRITAAALVAPAALVTESPRTDASDHGGVRLTARELWWRRILLPVVTWVARLPGLDRAAGAAVSLVHPLMRQIPALRHQVPTPGVVRTLARAWQHAVAPGPQGWAHDDKLLATDWSPSLDRAAAALRRAESAGTDRAGRPQVQVWHGTRDRTVAVESGRSLAHRLGVPLVEDTEAGHLGILLRHTSEIVSFLAQAGR